MTEPDTATLLRRAKEWLDQDPDPETRAELAALIRASADGEVDALVDLADRFDGRLRFGTAGLRGRLGPGSNRINRVLVAQTAAGFAQYLTETGRSAGVVIGYDGRKNSYRFAVDIAAIMAGSGIATTLLPRKTPTPVLAFAVRHLAASAGIMVTASHNPAQDNGLKVYLGDEDSGAQIVSPEDLEIATRIANAALVSIDTYGRSNGYRILDEELIDAYVAATARLGEGGVTTPRFVYTALHGVGWEIASAVFAMAGFSEVIPVMEQQHPDPDFPTVAFPNPEEAGALDLAISTAETADVELILANDPDADRLAVAFRASNGWRRLTGNEVGLLLGWREAQRHASCCAGGRPGHFLAASVVSSPALSAIASRYGIGYVETLTGFKYISRVPGLVYGFEEALGYLVDPAKIRDKDGISAAVEFLSLVSELRARDISLEQQLHHLEEEFGTHASDQVSIRVESVARSKRIMTALRSRPPRSLCGFEVAEVDDFGSGIGGYPPSDILRFLLADGSRVVIRPSGTEPKLKAYIDVHEDSGPSLERRTRASERVRALVREVKLLLDEADE